MRGSIPMSYFEYLLSGIRNFKFLITVRPKARFELKEIMVLVLKKLTHGQLGCIAK
jgi:hypothetical protein